MSLQATVSYITPTTERAYYYLHQVPEGQAARNVHGDRREVRVEDARGLSPAPTLEREGVELVPWDAVPRDEHDARGFKRDFYPQVEAMVRQVTNAERVVAFDHNVRSSEKGVAEGSQVQAPVRLVHNDYTESSAPQRVRDLLPEDAEALLKNRFSIINVWKPIHVPVSEAPLAVCDAQTLRPADMIETELRYPDRTGSIYSFAYSPGHRWLYFSAMRPDEAMLIKCYDSQEGQSRFTAHSAIDEPRAAGTSQPRQSIEVRTFAFFGPAD